MTQTELLERLDQLAATLRNEMFAGHSMQNYLAARAYSECHDALRSLVAEAKPARRGIYVASRVKRAEMWQCCRSEGAPIISTWIDEANEGDSADLGELWSRIEREVKSAERLVFYAETEDFPHKGALVEVGIALAAGIPVVCVLPGVTLEPRSMRPLGSWATHPLVSIRSDLKWALMHPATSTLDLDQALRATGEIEP
jgi:hypothetical protein